MRQVLRIAWYRFGATFARRWGGYLTIVLLIGLLGGVSMASVAGARRTQSSYPTFLASANPSDLTVSVYSPNSGVAVAPLTAKIVHLDGVRRVSTSAVPQIVPLANSGAPRLAVLDDVTFLASVDGMFLDQDRLAIVRGRRADPNRTDEMVMDASAATLLNVSVGQTVPMGLYTEAQGASPGFGTASVKPRLQVNVRLVGIVVVDNQVVEDDVDRAYGFVYLTPALAREDIAISPAAGAPLEYAVQLDHGGANVPAVEQEITHLLPPGSTAGFHVAARVVTEVELAVKPESVALGAFGAIAALVCLVLGVQAISRQLQAGNEDRLVLRALGAEPKAIAADGLIGTLAAVGLGVLVALCVSVAMSPLAPLGPVRQVYPERGIAADWAVLGTGAAILVGVLGAAAVALSFTAEPQRIVRAQLAENRRSTLAHSAEAAGLPVTAVMGVRFAVEPGRGRSAVPVRSALVGSAVAVALVVATLTFASSLRTLVSHPALYGWNWNYALAPTNALPPTAQELLNHDPDVAAWTGFDYNDVEIDAQTVPVLLARSTVPVLAPPILSGHGLHTDRQAVMGAATLAVLHKHVGDTVVVSYGSPTDAPLYIPPTRLTIVGTATFPAVGYESLVADHTSMGSGAMFSEGIFPPAFEEATRGTDPTLNGPELAFVRLRSDVSSTAGRIDMQRIADAANKVLAADPAAINNNVIVLGVQRPAQIVDYRSIGSTPFILAVGLAVGATAALAFTLIASVRRRRPDLALLKALGFTPRQVAAAIRWQASICAVIGTIVGVPLGIAVGRQLWILFARNLDAVPNPTVPVISVLLVALGALVFANVVAALPGRMAARTSTSQLLRAE